MNYISVKDASVQWNMSERRITALCRAGRIDGAKKEQGLWLIPSHADKPTDGRQNRSAGLTERPLHTALPIGVSDYRKLVSGDYYYVDKTLLIKDILDAKHGVSLFLRPRRFGKTLSMSMLKTFFEISEEDTSVYFRDKMIWSCGSYYREEQGKYPVIFMTFKDVKFRKWEDALESIRSLIAGEYQRHSVLADSVRCGSYDRQYYRKVLDGETGDVMLADSLKTLSRMLYLHYGKPAVIIIDEYDTPIQEGYLEGYYDDVVSFMRILFSGAFKDNENLAFGFLTGILRVAKESIFSGLNNLKVNSVLEKRYSEYFGFTPAEVRTMAEDYGHPECYEELCAWYDGYRFGDSELFNPWSVLNYFDEDCIPKPFWQSTGDNSIIRQIVSGADPETADSLRKLMQGASVPTYIDTSVIYPEIHRSPSNVFSFLLSAGYLKTADIPSENGENGFFQVRIPNKEITLAYGKEILSALSDIVPQSTAIAVRQALNERNIQELQTQLKQFLMRTVSVYDTASENFYHGLMLGLCAVMNDYYFMDSNRESGYGRYDIALTPRDLTMPGILMELKVLREPVSEEDAEAGLKARAQDALRQIDGMAYETAMLDKGVLQIVKIGIAFRRKDVVVVCETGKVPK